LKPHGHFRLLVPGSKAQPIKAPFLGRPSLKHKTTSAVDLVSASNWSLSDQPKIIPAVNYVKVNRLANMLV
jgi:hypothetical protein